MTYSSTDFADDIFNELVRVGAIHVDEADDEKLENQGLQGTFALNGIARLVAVRDAAIKYRQTLTDLATRSGSSPDALNEADAALATALGQVGIAT